MEWNNFAAGYMGHTYIKCIAIGNANEYFDVVLVKHITLNLDISKMNFCVSWDQRKCLDIRGPQ